MSTLVRLLVFAVPLAVIVIGLVQLNTLRRVPGRTTQTPIGIAVAIGAMAALVVEVALAGLAGMDVGVRPEHYLFALPFALGAGGGVVLAGLAGYGLLAKAGASNRLASVGILVVPVILGLSMQVGSDFAGGVDESERATASQQERAHMADSCSALDIGVDVVSVDFSPTNGIDRLTIDLTFKSADDVGFETGGFVTAYEIEPDVPTPSLHNSLAAGGTIELKSGAPVTYPVTLTPRTDEPRQRAGAWRSVVWLTSTDGETYICAVPFVVPAKTA